MDVELRDIHKRYGSVPANRGISLRVSAGSVHGILGENGAGKSTLMKILAGHTERTSGTIRVGGKDVACRTPAEAARLGIGMLYQDPLDFPPLTSLENFMLGSGRELLPARGAHSRALGRLAEDLGFTVRRDAPAGSLTLGERQQLELLRLLALRVGILILDEPTTGISGPQRHALFSALRKLAQAGKTVLLVSHKLDDVEALCDRVTVLRHGAVAGEMERPFRPGALVEMMFDTPPALPPRRGAPGGETLLRLRGVEAGGDRSGLRNCDVSIHGGEVVGLAGIEGSGQGVFLRAAAGLQRPRRGAVEFRGEPLGGRRYPALRREGVAFLPSRRLEEGLFEGLTVVEHFTLNRARRRFFSRREEDWAAAEEALGRYRIRGSPGSRVEALSGGNQQRLLLSLIPEGASLLLLENPTRGLDLESTAWVWQDLQRRRAAGATIVFSSPELDEILLAADRVLVFYNGAIALDAPADRLSPDGLGRAIAGKTA